MKLVVACYLFESEDYCECAAKIEKNPDISITMIEGYNPTSTFDIISENGECSISEDELSEILYE